MRKFIIFWGLLFIFMSFSVNVYASTSKDEHKLYKVQDTTLLQRGDIVVNDYETLIKKLRWWALKRKTEVTYVIPYDLFVDYKNKFVFEDNKDTIVDDICGIDYKTSDVDGPYLDAHLDKTELLITQRKWKDKKFDSSAIVKLTFNFTYRTTFEEEQYIEKNVKSVVEKLDIQGKSEYEKIKLLHDYVVNSFSYDSSLKVVDVYNLLKTKQGVCQAYALYLYCLYKKVGIPVVYIQGVAGDVNTKDEQLVKHAWLGVKYKGMWYYVDPTWDDPLSENNTPILSHLYFLRSPSSMKPTHKADEAYVRSDLNWSSIDIDVE